MRRLLLAVATLVTLAAPSAALVQPAVAAPAAVDPAAPGLRATGALAHYQGRVIDLGKSWEGAAACSVSKSVVNCYDSKQAMVAAERGAAKLATTQSEMTALAGTPCPSGTFTNEWVCLYDLPNFQGRMLKFKDANYCQTLVPYGFQNHTSSVVNTLADYVFLYQSGNDTVCFDYIVGVPGASSRPTLGAYDNKIDALYIFRT